MKTVTIDVQYKASIIAFTAMNTMNAIVHHGDEVAFTCDVDSDPPANISILSTNGSILKKIHGNNRFNYIKNISCLEDIGQFTCLSANKHNLNEDMRNVTVDVKCSPLYRPNYFQKTTFKTKQGRKVEVLFSIFSNPPPTQFSWTNISNNMQLPIDPTTSDRVIINTTDDMSSALIITSVEPWDSGIYSVRVENEVGSKAETFLIVVDIYTELSGGSSTSANSDNYTGRLVGGTVGAVGTVVIAAVLLAIFFHRKRQSRSENDRLRDESTLKEESRFSNRNEREADSIEGK